MTRLTATFLMVVLLAQIAPVVSANSKGDWWAGVSQRLRRVFKLHHY